MAFRGRGGRGAHGGPRVNPEPVILFPEDVTLPDVKEVPQERALFVRNYSLQMYWKSSPYFLEEATPTKNEDSEIERYSDRGKPRSQAKRDPLSYHLKLVPTNFPAELIQGSRRVVHDQRKVRWDPESGLHKLDMLEKLEEKYGDKADKEKKEDENEDDEVEVEDEEFSDDGDYNQNIDFDDDEDDFNMDDGADDEPIF